MEFKADTLDDSPWVIMGRLLTGGDRIPAGKDAALGFTSVLVPCRPARRVQPD